MRQKPEAKSLQHGQRGVAAIEFSLVVLTFLILFYGVVTFGAALYTKQVVARAAGDGARAAALVPSLAANDPRVQRVIYASLASSLIAPAGTAAQRLQWLQSNVSLTVTSVGSPLQARVEVSYPYRANPILPAIPLTNSWMPTNLRSSATAPLLGGG